MERSLKKPTRNDEEEEIPEGFLRELGLAGLEGLELPVLSSLVTGDPLLMIGTHGSGKTALAGAIAENLGLRFHAYDASKALFEDIVGFPNPSELGEGRMAYVNTDLTLWDKEFLLVDEISRANHQTQSNWLEIIRSRTLMGEPLSDLKYIFAAMNPPGEYRGTRPLDAALAGRFAWIVSVPGVTDMELPERETVIGAVSADDAPLARDVFDTTVGGSEPSVSLRNIIKRVRNRLPAVRERFGQTVRRYLSCFAGAFEENREEEEAQQPLDGRRLGFLYRNLLTAIAVRDEEEDRDLLSLFRTVLDNSLPYRARDLGIPEHTITVAHQIAFEAAFSDGTAYRNRDVTPRAAINRALEAKSIREAFSYLTVLGGYVNELTDLERRETTDLEPVRRVVHTGLTLFSTLFRYGSLPRCETFLTFFREETDRFEDLALLLISWWVQEKYQLKRGVRHRSTRLRDLNENLDQRVSTLATALEQRLRN